MLMRLKWKNAYVLTWRCCYEECDETKGSCKEYCKRKKISAQLVLQNYMLERFLERVSVSDFQDNFIIKGGFLIASMIGLDSRATMDLDATIKRYPVSKENIQKMIEKIAEIDLDDDITFVFKNIEEIREGDEYTGYRIALSANHPPMAVPFKLDITTGDKITPHEIEYEYKLMMEERRILVLAYNIATIVAEKLETVISRGDQNTRPRDYYDIYILMKLQADNVDIDTLAFALDATAKKRGSTYIIKQYREIMEVVKNSEVMGKQWDNYQKDFDYAANIEFVKTCDTVIRVMESLPEL